MFMRRLPLIKRFHYNDLRRSEPPADSCVKIAVSGGGLSSPPSFPNAGKRFRSDVCSEPYVDQGDSPGASCPGENCLCGRVGRGDHDPQQPGARVYPRVLQPHCPARRARYVFPGSRGSGTNAGIGTNQSATRAGPRLYLSGQSASHPSQLAVRLPPGR